jgi:hypothetical protein
MTDTRIVLHIGAHKTATTHLQRSILAARAPLAAQGVQVYGPPQLRGEHMTLLRRFDLPGSKDGPGDPQGMFVDMLNDGHRIVFSEENLIGSLLTRYGKMAEPIYPDAPLRIGDLASKVAPKGIDVCLGIRQPTHFLSSAYGQHLMSGGTLPLKKFLWKNPPRIVDWAHLIKRLRETVGVRSLTVWKYEEYREVFDQITQTMLGTDGAALVRPLDRIVHQGISQEAAAQIEKMHAEGTKSDFWASTRAAYPVGPDSPSFTAFGAIEHAASRVGYKLQLRKIAAMDGVHLIQPRA